MLHASMIFIALALLRIAVHDLRDMHVMCDPRTSFRLRALRAFHHNPSPVTRYSHPERACENLKPDRQQFGLLSIIPRHKNPWSFFRHHQPHKSPHFHPDPCIGRSKLHNGKSPTTGSVCNQQFHTKSKWKSHAK